MFKSYIVTALRNLWRHKIFSLINIAGLSIGISAALVIYLIVQYELSYDRFHGNGERIFRVTTDVKFPGLDINNSGSPLPLGDAIRSELSSIEKASKFILYSNQLKVNIPGNEGAAGEFKDQDDLVFSDHHYFSIFKYNWLAGNPASLSEPFQVVMTRERAESYFGKSAPATYIGKSILYNDTITCVVAGVVEDFKHNTDFTFKEFISIPTLKVAGMDANLSWLEWGSVGSDHQLFVLLASGRSAENTEKEILKLVEKHSQKNPVMNITHRLQPLNDIHFNSSYDNFNGRRAHLPTLFGLLAVAAFLLLLGCINFINLTTAQSSTRAKEIGVRKTMGGTRAQLIFQFLNETLVLTILATMVSFVLTPLILQVFSDYVPPGLENSIHRQPYLWLFAPLLIGVVTLLAGLYPAFFLSRLKPVTVLKNQAFAGTGKTRKAFVRKGLTVSQFSIAQIFIIATIIVSQQIQFGLQKDLGFDKDAIVYVRTPWKEKDETKRRVLLQKVREIAGVENASLSQNPPASSSTNTTTIKYTEGEKELETSVEIKDVDNQYFDVYGMKLLAGQHALPSDTIRQYVINQTYATFLGFNDPSDAVGKMINDKPISGVIADFHTKGLHESIKPLAFTNRSSGSIIHVKLASGTEDGGSWTKTLAAVEKAYNEVYPGHPYESHFFDESIAAFYKKERDIARLLAWASGLAVFISCLGLLGLVIFTTHQRMKEIGVRKVLGATVPQIVALLSRDFLLLVLIAFIVAAPLAWYAMHSWLQNFQYRIDMSWWVFAVTALGMTAVALLTLSTQALRAARSNPVKNLRTE